MKPRPKPTSQTPQPAQLPDAEYWRQRSHEYRNICQQLVNAASTYPNAEATRAALDAAAELGITPTQE